MARARVNVRVLGFRVRVRVLEFQGFRVLGF